MLRLPATDREAFKEPLGPVYTDVEALLSAVERARRRHADAGRPDAAAGVPLVAVGDVVTAHLLRAGRTPDVAVIDGQTERRAVDEAIDEVLSSADGARLEVENEAATLSRALLEALAAALSREEPTTVVVDGEEDLATLPAILIAPDGASVVYGQPGEGMVHVAVEPDARSEARRLFSRLEGDVEAALDALGA
ncbi:MAG: GTP-dependent dephospho-CoA kinase family protein [Salinigranum sp.]